mgnify:CR=1 FL=1|uniref:fimbrillin family protein n=1 Tax=uncultured Bacteroides sp. TaxID=162156 RepID=UPI0025ECDF47|nr:fimbrillin family protein [uncultured Bacteroides sp.]
MRKETMKLSLYILSLIFSLCGCSQEELITPDTPGESGSSGHELAEGERCNVSLSVTGMPSIEQATTRGIPEGKNTVLMDFTNHELKSREGKEAGWISTEVRTEFGEEERAATRAIGADKMFQDGSKFRMLVFKGPYGGPVNMETPVANMVCQVSGNSAKFLSPSTTLGLLKGRYTFICFPADEKYNTWQVGEPKEKSKVPVSNDEDFVYCKVENKDMNTSSFNLSLYFARKCYKLTVKLLVAEELGYIVGLDTVPITVGNNNTTYPIVSTATCDLSTGTMSGHKNELIKSRIPVLDKGKIPQSFGSVDNMLIAPATGSTSKLKIGYPQITVLKPKGTDGSLNDSIFTIKAGFVTTEDAFTFETNKSYTITLSIGEQPKGILVTFKNSSNATHKIVFARSQLYYSKTTGKYAIGKEQCDYGYVEAGIAPNTGDSKLVTTSAANYYFMYGCLDPFITADTGNGTNSEAGGMSGYYSGSSDLNTIGRDPCQKYGKDWMSPNREVLYWMGFVGTHYSNGSSKSKPSTDYFPIDENGNRLNTSGNPYFGTYTPTDNRSNKTAVQGMWIGLSSTQAKSSSNTKYNKSALFLPAAGYRDSGGTSMGSVGSNGYCWSSQQYNSSIGQGFFFFSSGYNLNYYSRNYGFPVRCCLPE